MYHVEQNSCSKFFHSGLEHCCIARSFSPVTWVDFFQSAGPTWVWQRKELNVHVIRRFFSVGRSDVGLTEKRIKCPRHTASPLLKSRMHDLTFPWIFPPIACDADEIPLCARLVVKLTSILPTMSITSQPVYVWKEPLDISVLQFICTVLPLSILNYNTFYSKL
jgi:hypothetical protein